MNTDKKIGAAFLQVPVVKIPDEYEGDSIEVYRTFGCTTEGGEKTLFAFRYADSKDTTVGTIYLDSCGTMALITALASILTNPERLVLNEQLTGV
jgi:hypothetical protein